MKPHEETWRVGDVGDEQTIFGPYGGQIVAEFEIDGDWDDTSPDRDDYAFSARRTRLAAAAPEMARLLLDMRGAELLPGGMEDRLEAVLRKAGVVEGSMATDASEQEAAEYDRLYNEHIERLECEIARYRDALKEIAERELPGCDAHYIARKALGMPTEQACVDIRKYVEEKVEEDLAERFPDPKRRAVARWIEGAASKCVAHRLITGRDPTEDEMRRYVEGASVLEVTGHG